MSMPIIDHLRSANAGFCLGGIASLAVGAGFFVMGAPFAMTALIAGGCVLAGSAVTSLVIGRLNPTNTFRGLTFAAGLGAAAFCLYSLAGPDGQHNRNRLFGETKALVAKFERAVSGSTPKPRHNNAPLPPAPAHADKDTGWIGVAPGGSSKR
ncbi:MAG: hypothetical protein ACAH83_11535 [Alphaproteobacteria bacterium]